VTTVPENIGGGKSQPAPGTVLSHYRLAEPVGAGGMGIVFRAVDTRLGRTVALKIIGPDGVADAEHRKRFTKEARAAAAINHPNIVTIYEVDSADGTDFIAMELVAGQPLDRRIPAEGLPVDEVLSYAEQMAAAMDAAHAVGIVHRDIKPANVIVSDTGVLKVLDFGVAKQLVPDLPDASTITAADLTRKGLVVGSLAYMSPEQAQGLAIDARSDVFSFGAVVYEMLTGRRPFAGSTTLETLAKVLEAQPTALGRYRTDIPVPLAALVNRCLDKDREQRPSSREIHERLREMREARASHVVRLGGRMPRPVLIAAAAVGAILVAGGTLWWQSGREVREARRRLPEILGLAERYDYDGFYRAARTVVPVLSEDLHLRQVWVNLTISATIDSQPSDAEVLVKGYSATQADWVSLGRTPIRDTPVPFGLVRAKLVKEGYAPLEVALNPWSSVYRIDPSGSIPEGMVRIPAVATSLEGISVSLPDFLMDKFEVTNRQYKAFVDAGGYRRQEFWKETFDDDGRRLTWEEAMTQFRDRTGRSGPSTWELGTYPAEGADLPVSGVSWYEAAAFAGFAGKSLPTAFQWRAAAGFADFTSNFADILTLSNFGMKGPARVGQHAGVGPWGTYDMAGNVKEWTSNASTGGRMILGGAWNEPTYMFNERDAQRPMQRLPTYGVRLVKNNAPQPSESYAPVPPRTRDYARETPIGDAAFSILHGLYRYDAQPLNVKIEHWEETPDWRHETVTFDAAYDGERIIAHVYLPRAKSPPYQSVVCFPGGDAPLLSSSRTLRLTQFDFIVRSGRALVFPVYKGTYERRGTAAGMSGFRDVTIARGKDFRRVLDYIASRPDLDRERVGYYGLSLGAFTGVLLTAIDSRPKASVLVGGGLPQFRLPPEIDPFTFAPHVRVPTLMVNGRSDFSYPFATSQQPLFRLLGVPGDRKRHVQLDGGHIPNSVQDLMREVLDWFDRYLGPV
jgi:dienelactone hydrolase